MRNEEQTKRQGEITDEDLKFIALNSKLSISEARGLFSGLTEGRIQLEVFTRVVGLCYPTVGKLSHTSLSPLTTFPDIDQLSRHVFTVFDPERSGDIHFRKFMLVVLALSSHTPEENAENIFYLVDKNKDGFISVEEYQAVTHDIFLLANERKISSSNKDQLMKSSFEDMDLNMDGLFVISQR